MKELSRRGYVKYVGAGIVAIAVAGVGAYYYSRPTTLTSVYNPVVEYASEKGLPDEIVNKLSVLGKNGQMNKEAKNVIDYEASLDEVVQNALTHYRSGPSQNGQKALDYQLELLDGVGKYTGILSDNKISPDENTAVLFLPNIDSEIQLAYIHNGFDDQVSGYLAYLSSMPDQQFAKYAGNSRLLIKDHQFTDLKKNFLKDRNGKDVLQSYIQKIDDSDYSDVGVELGKIPEVMKVLSGESNEETVKTVRAVESIYSIFVEKENLDKDGLKNTWAKFDAEGIKGKRKYNSPLRTAVWLYQENEPVTPINLIPYLFLDNPSLGVKSFVDDSWKGLYKTDKFSDFNEVTNLLNSPRLVDIYMGRNISYDLERYKHPPTIADIHTPEYTFKSKKGVCSDQSCLATYFLTKNGVKSCMLEIRVRERAPGHVVCLFKDIYDLTGRTELVLLPEEAYYTLDNTYEWQSGRPPGPGHISEPFSSIEKAVRFTASFSIPGRTYESYMLYDVNKNIISKF